MKDFNLFRLSNKIHNIYYIFLLLINLTGYVHLVNILNLEANWDLKATETISGSFHGGRINIEYFTYIDTSNNLVIKDHDNGGSTMTVTVASQMHDGIRSAAAGAYRYQIPQFRNVLCS